MKPTRVNVRTGDQLTIVIHGLPGWMRLAAAQSAARDLQACLGVRVVVVKGGA